MPPRINRLWLLFAVAFAISLCGAVVLVNPTLEFAAVDFIEKLHLPIGRIGNLALYAEAALFVVSAGGLIVLSALRLALYRRRKSSMTNVTSDS